MRLILVAALAVLPMLAKDNEPVKRLQEATAVISEIIAPPDRHIPEDMLAMNARGADKLLSRKFTLGAEGSVAAGLVGRTATAQTEAPMHAEILSGSRSQGLFAGLALEGATLRQDLDDNSALYGKRLENRHTVTTPVRTPRSALPLIALRNKYSLRERSSK